MREFSECEWISRFTGDFTIILIIMNDAVPQQSAADYCSKGILKRAQLIRTLELAPPREVKAGVKGQRSPVAALSFQPRRPGGACSMSRGCFYAKVQTFTPLYANSRLQ